MERLDHRNITREALCDLQRLCVSSTSMEHARIYRQDDGTVDVWVSPSYPGRSDWQYPGHANNTWQHIGCPKGYPNLRRFLAESNKGG